MVHERRPGPQQPVFDTRTEVTPGDARPLDRALRDVFPQASWSQVRRLIETGKVNVDGVRRCDPRSFVRAGQALEVRLSAPRPRAGALPSTAILHVDAHVVVVDKPAGISTVPYELNERGTLEELLRAELRRSSNVPRADAPLGVVHRLDKPTSGVMVFARTLSAKRQLEQQFRRHSIERRYLALCHGELPSQTLRSRLVQDRGDGLRGSTDHPRLGRDAITHVEALERFGSASLVGCRLETGRTHQIRIHLSEAGHPLLGEPVYVRNYGGPLLTAPRLMLHAAELGFLHPASGALLRFRSPPPSDMQSVLEELRRMRRP